MALRDKLRERAQPFLEPGEQIQVVFLGQTGPTPWLAGAFGAIIYMFIAKYRVIVVRRGGTLPGLVILGLAGARSCRRGVDAHRSSPPELGGGRRRALVRALRVPLRRCQESCGRITGLVDGEERHWVHRRLAQEAGSCDCVTGTAAPAVSSAPSIELHRAGHHGEAEAVAGRRHQTGWARSRQRQRSASSERPRRQPWGGDLLDRHRDEVVSLTRRPRGEGSERSRSRTSPSSSGRHRPVTRTLQPSW